MRIHIAFVILYGFICTTGQAQQTSISMQFKPRMELRDGYQTLPVDGTTPAFHTNTRVRLQMGYTSNRVEVVAQPQYIYVWGQNSFNSSADNNFSLYQAYAQLNLAGKTIDSTAAIDKVAFRIGRQELNYDGGRILSNLDWAPQGIRHDAALFILEDGVWSLHAGAGYNQDGPANFGSNFSKNYYKSFQMVRLHREGKAFKGSLLFFKDDFQQFETDSLGIPYSTEVTGRINAGTWLSYAISPQLSVEGEYYVQKGKDPTGNDLNAWLMNAQLVWKAIEGKLVITPGIDIVSGNDGLEADPVNHAFNPTYGINHKFYGFMDYFYTSSPFGSGGLQDIFVRTSYKINNDWNTWVHFHYFASAGNINDVSDPGNAADPYFGTEVDWVLNYRFDQTTQLQFGAATMLGSSTLQQVKGQPATDGGMGFFSYLQFQFTPKFL
ncbi:MAG TPA: hypothetical protein PK742_04875 [Chitinophagales bacterium]|nr:hypothetical protein [Bacteroidota bacterium]HQU75958.1 hypothetical protein [Chitinophagales bacterium]